MWFSSKLAASVFMTAIILLPPINLGRDVGHKHLSGHGSVIRGQGRQASTEVKHAKDQPNPKPYNTEKKERPGGSVMARLITLQVAGSSLPDCSHACGSCSPCRLVMVSFICKQEAETCPMAYKCMCNRKPYPVP